MAKRSKLAPAISVIFLLILLGVFVHVRLQESPPAQTQQASERKTETASPAQESERPASAPTPAPPPALPTPPPADQGATTLGKDSETWTPGRFDQSFTFAGLPEASGYPNSITVLTNTAFVIGYDEVTRNPAWAAYRIAARSLDGKFPRPSRFNPDTRTLSQVKHEVYTNSGYDRGHMVPNYAIASRFGAEAQKETFLMSNVVPQSPALNQGPWRLMEETLVEKAAVSFETVWVIVGPLYHSAPRTLRSGVRIPDAFFCLVADETSTGPRLQAFILPQETPRNARFQDYLTTVDEVERASGLDYFRDLPDALEEGLESATPRYWLE